jgi:hypothetical protein
MRNIQLITDLPYNLPPIENVIDTLPKHPKWTWETMATRKDEEGNEIAGLRNTEEIDTIIIHHTASTKPLANQARYHVDHHDWPGVGYHLVVDEGKIKQCNDLLAFTYHAKNHNDNSVAICVNWDLRLRDLTSLERELLYAAILTVKALLPIRYVIGHNEVNKTSCPCTSMNQIRSDIKTLEMKIQQQQSWEAKLGKVGEIINQINYMNSLIKKGPENGEARWALDKQMEVYEIMKSKGLL